MNRVQKNGQHFVIPRVMPGDGEGDAPSAEDFAKLQTQIDTMATSMTAVTEERDLLKTKHDEAEKHRKAAETKAKKDLEDAMRQNGDVAALEQSWSDKLDAANAESSATITGLNGIINKVTVGASATAMAAELAVDGSAAVLEPHIRSRLVNEIVDGNSVIKVLGVDGKPSASTLDDLKAEISGNDAFAPILKGSGASGGGQGGKGPGQQGGKTMKRSAYDQLSVSEQARAVRVDKIKIVDD